MATITVTELAATLETDPRTTRKFLRSITAKADQPGKGSRWSIEKKSVRSLTSQFKKWTADNEAAKAARDAEKAAQAVDETPEISEVDADEVLETEIELDAQDDAGEVQDEDDEDDDLPMPKHDD
jgi:hypothetical protein